MATDKQQRREAALTSWSVAAGSAGFAVPDAGEIARIATAPDTWRSERPSPAALDWGDTIAHIVHQIKFGMDPSEVVRHLPVELRIPKSGVIATPTPPDQAAGPTDVSVPVVATPATKPVEDSPQEPGEERQPETAIDALIAWRARRIAEGADSAETINDVTFLNLIKYKRTAPDQVKKQLRGPAGALAPEISAILQSFLGVPEPVAATEPRAVTTPAVADAPPRTARPNPSSRDEQKTTAVDSSTGSAAGLELLRTEDFCEYEYGETDVPRADLQFSKTADGYRLVWPAIAAASGTITLYRLVTGEGFAPHKPEAGELIGVVQDTSWEDARFFTSSVRHYQVWAHTGADAKDARQQQPVCIAKGEIVSPVTEFHLSEDEGRVIGQWSAWPGTNAVRIYRIPLDAGPPVMNDPRNEICGGQQNLTGFVDTGVDRGARYLYQAKSEVSVDGGIRLSQPAQGDILVSVVLTAVSDLEVTSGSASTRMEFDLSWSNPESGEVIVYRTEFAPPAGLQDAELDQEALEPQGLTTVTRLKHPAIAGEANTSRMVGVPWPSGWDRAYLTPVTVLGGHARVGATMVQTRPIDPVTSPRIIERGNKQIATFGWPKSASTVCAHIGPRGVPIDDMSMGSAMEEISSRQYRRDGGLSLNLPAGGCAVHLLPVAFSRGERIVGQPTTIDYNGLTRMNYALQPAQNSGASGMTDIFLRCEVELDDPTAFVMVFNPDRLPLSARDGRSLSLVNPSQGRPTMQASVPRLGPKSRESGWQVDLSQVKGYVRLFVDLDSVYGMSRTFALQDPPVATLRRTSDVDAPR